MSGRRQTPEGGNHTVVYAVSEVNGAPGVPSITLGTNSCAGASSPVPPGGPRLVWQDMADAGIKEDANYFASPPPAYEALAASTLSSEGATGGTEADPLPAKVGETGIPGEVHVSSSEATPEEIDAKRSSETNQKSEDGEKEASEHGGDGPTESSQL